MLIVAGRDGPAGRAAVVRGWIQELAWYEPGRTPGFSLLLARNSRLYHMPTRDSSSAVASLAGAVESDSSPGQAWELVVDSGLAVGHIYGQDAERGNRPDTFYAWYVESRQAIRPEAARSFLGPAAVQWRLVYRTAPDHQIVDIVSGLAITRYVYGHHGTVADTDVKLVSVKMQR
jgi:hypothetical protein